MHCIHHWYRLIFRSHHIAEAESASSCSTWLKINALTVPAWSNHAPTKTVRARTHCDTGKKKQKKNTVVPARRMSAGSLLVRYLISSGISVSWYGMLLGSSGPLDDGAGNRPTHPVAGLVVRRGVSDARLRWPATHRSMTCVVAIEPRGDLTAIFVYWIDQDKPRREVHSKQNSTPMVASSHIGS
jgi:hypothetical protein